MRFDLDAEQADLADLARRVFDEARDDDQARTLARVDESDPKSWARIATETGFPAVAVPAEHDGADGSWLDLAVVLEASGHAVSSQPLLATAGMAVAVLRAAGDGAHDALAEIAGGEKTATWVDAREPGAGFSATLSDGGWSLTGSAQHVVQGDLVETFLMTARTAKGIGLFSVDRSCAEVTTEEALDPSRSLATVTLRDSLALAYTTELDPAELERAQATARILLSAEQVGVGQGILDLAVATP